MESWFAPACHAVVLVAKPDALTSMVRCGSYSGEDETAISLGRPPDLLAVGAQQDLRLGNHGAAAVFHHSTQFLRRRRPGDWQNYAHHDRQDYGIPKLYGARHALYLAIRRSCRLVAAVTAHTRT